MGQTDQRTFHESSLEKNPEKTWVDQISFMRLTAKGKKSNPLKASDGYNDGVFIGNLLPPFQDSRARLVQKIYTLCLKFRFFLVKVMDGENGKRK